MDRRAVAGRERKLSVAARKALQEEQHGKMERRTKIYRKNNNVIKAKHTLFP